MTSKAKLGCGVAVALAIGWTLAHRTDTAVAGGTAGTSTTEATSSSGIIDNNTVRGGETYTQFDARRDALAGSAGTYAGDGCTEDCSGHDAGHQWAEEHEITDPDDCGGKSWSFEEGCRTYAEEQRSEDDQQSESEREES